MKKSQKQMLIDALKKGVVKVSFTKKNGDKRLMECTLNFDLIPPECRPRLPVSQEDDTEKTNLSVFATDIQEWRSFILANVIEWNCL